MSLLLLFPGLLLSSMKHMIWKVPLASLGQLSLLCPLITPCPLPTYTLGDVGEGMVVRERERFFCARTVQQQPKHQCVTNTVSATNAKHSTKQAVMKKIDSIPARPSTRMLDHSEAQSSVIYKHWYLQKSSGCCSGDSYNKHRREYMLCS